MTVGNKELKRGLLHMERYRDLYWRFVHAAKAVVPTLAQAVARFRKATGLTVLQDRLGALGGGNALILRGTGRVTIADAPTLRPGLSSFTVAFWLKMDNPANQNGVICKGSPVSTFGPDREWAIGTAGSSSTILYNETESGSRIWALSANAGGIIDREQWNYYVFVRDRENDEARWYVNGILTNTIASPAFIDLDGPRPISIGARTLYNNNPSYPHQNGDYGPIQIFSNAMTDADVAEIYRSGVPYRYRRGAFVQNTENMAAVGSFVSGTYPTGLSPTGFENVCETSGNAGVFSRPIINLKAGDIMEARATVSDLAGSVRFGFFRNDSVTWSVTGSQTLTQSANLSANTGGIGILSASGETFIKFRCGSDLPVRFGIGSANAGRTFNLSNLQLILNGAVIDLSSDTIGMEPGQWRDASGNGHNGLIHTEGAYSALPLDEDLLQFRGVNATGGAYLGRSGDMAREGADVEEVTVWNRSGSEAVDVVLQYSNGSAHTDMFPPLTIPAGGKTPAMSVTVPKPAGRNRYRLTGTSGLGNLDLDIRRTFRHN